jgi:hypothetical protein
LGPDLADFQINSPIGFAVSGVEKNGVDAGVSEEGCVAAEGPRIHGVIIAEEGFAPLSRARADPRVVNPVLLGARGLAG